MKIKKSSGYRAFSFFNYIFMIFIIIVMLYPYLSVLAKAFNEGADTARGGITIFPRKVTFDNFKTILGEASFKKSLIVSVTRVITGVLFGLYVQFTAAYALTRRKFPFKGFILMLFVVPMYISAGQIPIYVLYSKIKLLNTFWVYILPVLFSFYNITVIRTYMQTTIPESLYESAFLDGANEITIFWRICIPLCMPIMATVALWIMVQHWNDWTTTLYYIRKPALFKESERLQKLIEAAREMGQELDNSTAPTSEALTSAQIIVTTVPIICVYPFLQKYFVKGVMLGAVKG